MDAAVDYTLDEQGEAGIAQDHNIIDMETGEYVEPQLDGPMPVHLGIGDVQPGRVQRAGRRHHVYDFTAPFKTLRPVESNRDRTHQNQRR